MAFGAERPEDDSLSVNLPHRDDYQLTLCSHEMHAIQQMIIMMVKHTELDEDYMRILSTLNNKIIAEAMEKMVNSD